VTAAAAGRPAEADRTRPVAAPAHRTVRAESPKANHG
jgi:hypothetical protein